MYSTDSSTSLFWFPVRRFVIHSNVNATAVCAPADCACGSGHVITGDVGRMSRGPSLSRARAVRAGDETKRLEKNRIHRQRRQHDGYSPLFVTWNVRPSRPGRSHRLRGCIGSFEPHALHEGIAEYARISAFKDYRFNKITRGELDSLECV